VGAKLEPKQQMCMTNAGVDKGCTPGMSAASGRCRCLQMEETQEKACCMSSGSRAPPVQQLNIFGVALQ
jgi:hypothetical protein